MNAGAMQAAGRPSIMDEEPPVRPEAPKEPDHRWHPLLGKQKRGVVTPADRQMVADAIAAGFPITRCPPHKYSVEPGQPDVGSVGKIPVKIKTRRERIQGRLVSSNGCRTEKGRAGQ